FDFLALQKVCHTRREVLRQCLHRTGMPRDVLGDELKELSDHGVLMDRASGHDPHLLSVNAKGNLVTNVDAQYLANGLRNSRLTFGGDSADFFKDGHPIPPRAKW